MSKSSTRHRSPTWWKDVVIYQIYPRSFADSDGDGIGDLNGIIGKLDHLAELGVDVVWLSPHFDSPNADNGYDIRDYRKVMTEFGTMEDFDRMLAAMNERGIELVIDLVVNHTSDEHSWFRESRSSRDNPYRNYYIWRDGTPDGGPPNNYTSFFGGSAWTHDPTTDQWYLHYFDAKQPDLNWEEPRVRDEVLDIMRFWLDKGVAGFRMDVIPLISKQPGLPDLTPDQLADPASVYADGPRVHEWLAVLHREVLEPYNAMSIGEALGVSLEKMPLFVDSERGELSMMIMFDLVRIDMGPLGMTSWELPGFKQVVSRIDRAVGESGWTTSYLTNHDNPRAVSHFGDDSERWRSRSAKALATLMLTMRATPILYQGDELGMTNFPFETIDDFDDVAIRRYWRDLVESGMVPGQDFIDIVKQFARDNARTPMQWDAGSQAGFTTGEPWLAVNPNYTDINAASQVSDTHSVFHHHRNLIELRRNNPTLVHGAFEDIDPDHEQIFAYTRSLGDETLLVLINFGETGVDYPLPGGVVIKDRIIDNTGESTATNGATAVWLAPWQATVYSLGHD